MSERDRLYLVEILEAATAIRSHIAGLDKDDYLADLKTRDAVSMRLLQLGEAVARLSEETRQRRPEAPWPKIVGLRHRLAHGYASIDHGIIWSVSIEQVDDLAEIAELLISELNSDAPS